MQKEVKTQLTDPSSEINFTVIQKKEKNNPDAKKYFLQITKTSGELGSIPFSDFLSKMNETEMLNGIVIITSHFAADIPGKAKNENGEIILIDADKLKRYL